MTAFNDTFGIIGLSSENVGIDRRIYTGLTSTNPQLNISYNSGRVDVYLNGVKLMGNHSGQNNYDYTYQGTGAGSAITLSTGVALVATDTIECIGYVSNSSNTVTSYNPTPANADGGWNVFANITQTASDLVNVFLNGVLLDDSDYTLDSANNKVTIGGATLTASDVVVIQVIGALDHSNFVPASGGTFSGNVSVNADITTQGLTVESASGQVTAKTTGDHFPGVIFDKQGTSVGAVVYDTAQDALEIYTDDFSGQPQVTVDNAGKVGIGITPPVEEVHIAGDDPTLLIEHTASSYGESNLKLGNDSGSNASQIQYDSAQASLYIKNLYPISAGQYGRIFFQQNVSGSLSDVLTIDNRNVSINNGNLVIGSAGKGIDFSAGNPALLNSPSSDSEVLSEYERGYMNYPLQMRNSSTGAYQTINDGHGGSNRLYFEKIGNVVTCEIQVDLDPPRNNGVNLGGASSYIKILLPFTVSSNLTGFVADNSEQWKPFANYIGSWTTTTYGFRLVAGDSTGIVHTNTMSLYAHSAGSRFICNCTFSYLSN